MKTAILRRNCTRGYQSVTGDGGDVVSIVIVFHCCKNCKDLKSDFACISREIGRMSAPIEYKSRAGVVPCAGQQLELSPCELAMARVSLFMKGNMRPSIVSIIEGTQPSAEAFSNAAAKLADRHPILKCKFVQTSPEPAAVDSTWVVEMDESLKIPVFYHDAVLSNSSYDAINDAWKSVWSEKIENVCYFIVDLLF